MAAEDFEIANGELVLFKGSDTTAVIPDGVTELGPNSFSNNQKIQEVYIPKSVKKLSTRCFCECGALKKAVFDPASEVTEICDYAFSGCVSLDGISLPPKLLYLGENSFYSCISLSSVRLPEQVISIGQSCFEECISLEEARLPETLVKIGKSAFCGCKLLKEINIPDRIDLIDELTFFECKSLTMVIFPVCLEKIGERAFSYCNGLMSVNIPEGTVSIGRRAFACCKLLRTVSIPDDIVSIDFEAFEDCPNLYYINLPKKFDNEVTDHKCFENTMYYRKRHHLCLKCGYKLSLFGLVCRNCGFDNNKNAVEKSIKQNQEI